MDNELVGIFGEIRDELAKIAASLDNLDKKGLLMWIGEQKPEDN